MEPTVSLRLRRSAVDDTGQRDRLRSWKWTAGLALVLATCVVGIWVLRYRPGEQRGSDSVKSGAIASAGQQIEEPSELGSTPTYPRREQAASESTKVNVPPALHTNAEKAPVPQPLVEPSAKTSAETPAASTAPDAGSLAGQPMDMQSDDAALQSSSPGPEAVSENMENSGPPTALTEANPPPVLDPAPEVMPQVSAEATATSAGPNETVSEVLGAPQVPEAVEQPSEAPESTLTARDETVSATMKVTARFTVLADEEQGPPVANATVELSHRPSPEANPTVLASGKTDSDGIVDLDVTLDALQQSRGEYAATVSLGQTAKSFELREFPDTRQWQLHLPVPAPVPAGPPADKIITNTIGMKLVLIPAGNFEMGSAESESEHKISEYKHTVRITKPFYLGMCEVTQAEYRRVLGTNPSWFSASGLGKATVSRLDTSRFPVEEVSWNDAVAFCRKLSSLPAEKLARPHIPAAERGRVGIRLPRGTATPFHFGTQLNGSAANCHGEYPYGTTTKGPYRPRTVAVGSYDANEFGVHDMHGNVWEWCQDWADAGYYYGSPVDDPQGPLTGPNRVYRGGCFYSNAGRCRSAFRGSGPPSFRDGGLGFRVALELPGMAENPGKP